jgi:hypothetical protein
MRQYALDTIFCSRIYLNLPDLLLGTEPNFSPQFNKQSAKGSTHYYLEYWYQLPSPNIIKLNSGLTTQIMIKLLNARELNHLLPSFDQYIPRCSLMKKIRLNHSPRQLHSDLLNIFAPNHYSPTLLSYVFRFVIIHLWPHRFEQIFRLINTRPIDLKYVKVGKNLYPVNSKSRTLFGLHSAEIGLWEDARSREAVLRKVFLRYLCICWVKTDFLGQSQVLVTTCKVSSFNRSP